MKSGLIASIGTIVVILLVGLGMYGCPQYNIYAQRSEGAAQLAHSQSSKEVAVSEARAKMEAAELLAQADIKRAEGVAKANQIIGESLKENPEYLRWLWITETAGKDINKTVIYVPTEANIPILEANRLGTTQPPVTPTKK